MPNPCELGKMLAKATGFLAFATIVSAIILACNKGASKASMQSASYNTVAAAGQPSSSTTDQAAGRPANDPSTTIDQATVCWYYLYFDTGKAYRAEYVGKMHNGITLYNKPHKRPLLLALACQIRKAFYNKVLSFNGNINLRFSTGGSEVYDLNGTSFTLLGETKQGIIVGLLKNKDDMPLFTVGNNPITLGQHETTSKILAFSMHKKFLINPNAKHGSY